MLVNLSRKPMTKIASNSQSAYECVSIRRVQAMDCVLRSSSASLKSHIMYDLPFRGTNSRPGSISAECFQDSFLSMEYSCQAQVREQTGQARRTGWRSVRRGNVWRFALSNVYSIHSSIVSVAPANWISRKLHKSL